jgi:hypothetical protein
MPTSDAIRRALLRGRLPTPPEIVARHRITLAGSGLHRYQGTGLASSVINSTAAMVAAGGYTFGREMGNGTYENCCSAAAAWHKFLVTTATGATALLLPEGGNPYTSDSPWGTATPPTPGLASAVPSNTPGVIGWSQANSVLGLTSIATVLGKLTATGAWPNGGFVDAAGGHHPILSYGSIAPTNQTEVTLALQYFKTIIFGLSGDQMLSQWSAGSRFYSGLTANHNDSHAFTACDCGPASTLATQYGVSVPSGISSSAFCIAGITWGLFAVIDWASLCNVVSEGWVIIADPDRGDAATWNPPAQAYYRTMMGTNGTFLASALCSYLK